MEVAHTHNNNKVNGIAHLQMFSSTKLSHRANLGTRLNDLGERMELLDVVLALAFQLHVARHHFPIKYTPFTLLPKYCVFILNLNSNPSTHSFMAQTNKIQKPLYLTLFCVAHWLAACFKFPLLLHFFHHPPFLLRPVPIDLQMMGALAVAAAASTHPFRAHSPDETKICVEGGMKASSGYWLCGN